jgi:HlyD family secretion protein
MALSRKKKIIIGSAVAALLAIIILVSVFASRKDTPEVVIYKTEKRNELRSTVTASGEIRPIQYVNLTSEVQGRIVDIRVKEGDKVVQGEELVKLDPTQLQSSEDAQVAAFQASRDELQVTRSQVIAAQNQYSQAQQGLNASEAGVTTAQQQVTSAQQGVNSAQQQVATAKERVNQARQQVIAAETDVDRSEVELKVANREKKRAEELLESGVISKLEYDQARDRVENAEVSLRTSKANLETRKLAVNEALAGVKQTELGVKEAQSRVIEAKTRVNESQARANQQSVSVRDAKRGVDTANLSVNASQRRTQQQEAFLRGQKDQRDKTLQVAPINGIIAEIPSKVGTFAVAGLSTTPLLTIADMSEVNVEIKVDETEIDKVAVGQAAKIKIDAFGEIEVNGEVSQKTPLAVGKSQTSGGLSTNINVQEAKEFRVVVRLKDIPKELQEGLRPGMSATATITTNTVKDLISVPIQAVIEKKPEAKTEPTIQGSVPEVADKDKPKMLKGVYVLEDNKVKFVEVTTGITGESDIQVNSGLGEGQEIITGPSKVLGTLKDGDVVKKQTKKQGENANKS